jgi:large subunit ribosomal protein L25
MQKIGTTVKLIVTKRAGEKKSELNLMRHRGDIPAVLYEKGKEGVTLVVNGAEMGAVLRGMKPGHLPTTQFELDLEGKTVKAIIKEIQYDPTSYRVIHLDFYKLDAKTHVNVKVPLEFSGVAECEGIKLGGFLRPIMRHIKVRCLPKDLPEQFTLDVADVNLQQSRRVKNLVLPKGVTTLAAPEAVVVVIAKR